MCGSILCLPAARGRVIPTKFGAAQLTIKFIYWHLWVLLPRKKCGQCGGPQIFECPFVSKSAWNYLLSLPHKFSQIGGLFLCNLCFVFCLDVVNRRWLKIHLSTIDYPHVRDIGGKFTAAVGPPWAEWGSVLVVGPMLVPFTDIVENISVTKCHVKLASLRLSLS